MHDSILITGGAGFVGSSLALAIKRRSPSTHVAALDNLRRRGSELNLPRLAATGVAFLHADIRETDDLARIAPAPNLVIDCSAEPSAQAGYDGAPEYLIRTNILGCFHCLELARLTGADFLFLSTSRVYPYARLNQLVYMETEDRFVLGGQQAVPGASADGISEAFPLEGPRSLYGMTKLAAEAMIEEYRDAYGMRAIVNRCGLITGPGQMAKTDQGVIALWVAAHYFNRPLNYIGFGGQGKQVRDFLHIDDLADLVLDQIGHFSEYQGRALNVGGGIENSLSLRECTRLCEEIVGTRIPIGYEPENRPADVRIFITDARQVSAVSGWRPRRDARQTVSDLLAWLRENESEVRSFLP